MSSSDMRRIWMGEWEHRGPVLHVLPLISATHVRYCPDQSISRLCIQYAWTLPGRHLDKTVSYRETSNKLRLLARLRAHSIRDIHSNTWQPKSSSSMVVMSARFVIIHGELIKSYFGKKNDQLSRCTSRLMIRTPTGCTGTWSWTAPNLWW